jgi:transposase, IS5 family
VFDRCFLAIHFCDSLVRWGVFHSARRRRIEGTAVSRPREKHETGEQDLFRSRLEQITNMKHELVRLAQAIDWPVLEERFGAVYSDGPGMPPLPTRLMAGLTILKHTFGLSDEELCARWVENPYFQHLCGEEFFRHDSPFDRSSMTRWRQRMGEERLTALLQESLAVAGKSEAMKPADTRRGIVDTTVQPKNVMFPTDAKLIHRARERLGLDLRQTYVRVGKLALIKHQRYAHAKQFKRANKALRKLKTYLGRTIRDIARQIAGEEELETIFKWPLYQASTVLEQRQRQRGPDLQPARSRGRVHRQGQGACALRVRRQGVGRHHAAALKGRPVCPARQSAAGQSL